jgi:hypothetical protein
MPAPSMCAPHPSVFAMPNFASLSNPYRKYTESVYTQLHTKPWQLCAEIARTHSTYSPLALSQCQMLHAALRTCRDVPPSVCPALAKRAVSDSSQQGPKLAPASIPVQATTTECITSSHDLTTHSCLCAAALHAALGTQSASTAQGQLLHLPAQHAASCCHRGDQLYRPVQCCS